MISTYVVQDTFAGRFVGFSLRRNSGVGRYIKHCLRKQGIMVTLNDIVDSWLYMLSRGWLRESGQWGSTTLYSVVKKEKQT